MPRKKKPETPTEPQIETKPEPPVEQKVDYSELWFAERIGSKVEAVLGKDLTKNPALFHSFIGPFTSQEECLLAVEKKQAAIDKETRKHKAIAAAEPDPLSTADKESSKGQSKINYFADHIIMLPGLNAEITVKFNTRPSVPETGKSILLEITTEQGVTVRANVNRKTLKKQVEKMDTFTVWIAALSGKITRIDPNGVVELEGAGVVVFEKKPKEEAVTEVEAVTETVEA